VLILDHMARNMLTPPDSKTVEDHGHKLLSLFDATKTLCAAHGVTSLDEFQADSLPIRIIGFLDHFAHPGGRYSNINKLTGHKHQTMADPIVQWGGIASQIMQTHAIRWRLFLQQIPRKSPCKSPRKSECCCRG